MRVPFSSGVRSELVKSIYLSKISSSIISLLGSSSSKPRIWIVFMGFWGIFSYLGATGFSINLSGLVVISRMYIWYFVGRGRDFIISSLLSKNIMTFPNIVATPRDLMSTIPINNCVYNESFHLYC